jgi:predicted tellurium resistance membrane protein TerC
MRALYFLLAGASGRLRYLRPGLAVILAAVAVKLLLADVWAFPAWSAPAFIAVVLAVVAAASLRDNQVNKHSNKHGRRQATTGPVSDPAPPAVTGSGSPRG